MTTAMSVNLSLKTPRTTSKSRRKSLKISKTIRSFLTTSTPEDNNNEPSDVEPDRLYVPELHRKTNKGTPKSDPVLQVQEPPQVDHTLAPDPPHHAAGKSSRSSQTSAKSSARSVQKVYKLRRSRKQVLRDDAQIQWTIPEHVRQRLEDPRDDNRGGDGANRRGGSAFDEDGGQTVEILPKITPEHRGKSSSKRTKPKSGSQPSFYVYGHNRSASRHTKHSHRLRPSSKSDAADEQQMIHAKNACEILSRTCAMYKEELRALEGKSSSEILALKRENEKLQLDLFHVQKEVRSWQTKCQQQENRNALVASLNLLKQEHKGLKEDAEVLKSVIRRLNKEISFYQEKLHSKYRHQPSKCPVYSSSNPTSNGEGDEEEGEEDRQGGGGDHSSWLENPRAQFQPLLLAYDEIISEKTEIIKDYESAMQNLKEKCKGIVRENEELHKSRALSVSKDSVAFEEWKFLYDNAVLVLEENDLLHEHISALKRKGALLQSTCAEKESKFQAEKSQLEEDKAKLIAANAQLDGHCKALAQQVHKLSQSIQERVSVEENSASIRECKRLFEELKSNYTEDRKSLVDKITALEAEKHRLIVEVTNLGVENSKLEGTIQDLTNSLADNHAKLRKMYEKMDEASKAKEVTAKTVAEMMELAKAVVQDRESLEKSLSEQRNLNERMMSIRSRESELVNELREKIKVMQEAHREEMQKQVMKTKELQRLLDTIEKRHLGDTNQLKDLIEEKSKHIELLMAEKTQLTADLETVWRATTGSSRK